MPIVCFLQRSFLILFDLVHNRVRKPSLPLSTTLQIKDDDGELYSDTPGPCEESLRRTRKNTKGFFQQSSSGWNKRLITYASRLCPRNICQENTQKSYFVVTPWLSREKGLGKSGRTSGQIELVVAITDVQFWSSQVVTQNARLATFSS